MTSTEKISNEKVAPTHHVERAGSNARKGSIAFRFHDRTEEAEGKDADEFEAGYWKSPRFIGSLVAVGVGFAGGTGGFALIAPVLGDINQDIGPSSSILWVPIGYLLMQVVFFLLVGTLSDIFGRRWFFISGSCLSLIGCIIGAVAKDVPTLIGAQFLIGLASAFQISFFWVIAELVPMKWRYLANCWCYIASFPTNPMAPQIAFAFQRSAVGWRGSFYFMIALNVVGILCWYFFYHPPTFNMLHRSTSAKTLFITFDWIGLLLCAGGLTLILLGVQWGGGVFPWGSSAVIATMVVGGVMLFILCPIYEVWYEKSGRTPYLPVHLFKNMKFMSCAWLCAIGNGIYYGFSICWPQAVASIYQYQGEGLTYRAFSTLSGLVPMCFVLGQVVGTTVCTFTGPKPGIIATISIGSPILAAAAANPLNQSLTEGLIIVGCFFTGMMEGMAICTTTFPLRDQKEIGEGGGLSGTIRAFGSVVCLAIYSAILSNRLAVTIPANVVPAAEGAGLQASSIPALIAGLSGAGKLDAATVPGLTDQIIAIGRQAYAVANAQAFRTIFLTSFAFGGTGMILAWFVAQNDASQAEFVAGHVHTTEQAVAVYEKNDIPYKRNSFSQAVASASRRGSWQGSINPATTETTTKTV